MRKSIPVNAPTYDAATVAVADLLARQGRPWRVLVGVQIVDGTRRSIAPAATTSPSNAVAVTVTRPTGELRTYFVTIERDRRRVYFCVLCGAIDNDPEPCASSDCIGYHGTR